MDRTRDFSIFSCVGPCQLLQVGNLGLKNSLWNCFPQRSVEHNLVTPVHGQVKEGQVRKEVKAAGRIGGNCL